MYWHCPQGVKWYGVHLSVCPICPLQQHAAGLAAVGLAGRRY